MINKPFNSITAMKKLFWIILVIFLFETLAHSQVLNENHQYNKKGSYVWVSLMNGAVLGKGLLWKVSEDTLEFVNQEYKNKYLPEVPVLKIHYSEIKELKTTPRAAINKGMFTGAAIGFSLGLATGIATTENPDPYTKTEISPEFCLLYICVPASTYTVEVDEPRDAGTVIIKTLAMTAIGAVVGLAIGNKGSIQENLDGSREKYQALVPKLKNQAFWICPNIETEKIFKK